MSSRRNKIHPFHILFTLACFILFGLSQAAPVSAQSGEGGDTGDAPDRTNHAGVPMTTYPAAVPARFPTVWDPATGSPQGPLHWAPMADVWLGPGVSREVDADLMPDSDGVTNLDPPTNAANRDGFDDGVDLMTVNLPVCDKTTFEYTLTVVGPVNERYTNVWFDYNRDGDWDDVFDCVDANGDPQVVTEWSVPNQITAFGPGTYVVTTPDFYALDTPTTDNPLWMRITVATIELAPLGGVPSGHDGRGPNNGYSYGETEDYLLGGDPPGEPCQPQNPNWEECHDTGDAPDSTNVASLPMTTYPSGVAARFPTTYFGDPVPGPQHWMPLTDSWLGGAVTRELDADMFPDEDGPTNIEPPTNAADRDGADDGVDLTTIVIPACDMTTYDVTVTIVGPVNERYLNGWMDFNRDGDWEDRFTCETADGVTLVVSEWVVQNHVIGFGPGIYTLTVPSFAALNLSTPNDPMMWLRTSLSEAPVPSVAVPSGSDGRGPAGGFQFGETEDYLIDVPPPPVDDCPQLYMSFHGDGFIDGVLYNDEDIVRWDGCAGSWSLWFDGSANGVAVDEDIIAFFRFGTRLIVSTETAAILGGTANVQPEDLAMWTGVGWLRILDGSLVGLSGANIDAATATPGGEIAVSLIDTHTVAAADSCGGTAFTVEDEDLITFTPSSAFPNPTGCWSHYYDGSNVGQDTTAFEDMWAAHIDPATGEIYQSSMWTYTVTGSSGDGADVFVCAPSSLGGGTTACTFSDFWDGSLNGVVNLSIDGLDIGWSSVMGLEFADLNVIGLPQ